MSKCLSDSPAEALKRSNDALKNRCEEIEGWQRKSREEREFLSGKFHEARVLVERLAQENKNLLGKLNSNGSHVVSQGIDVGTETACQNRNKESSCANSNGLLDNPNVSLHKQCQISFFFFLLKHSLNMMPIQNLIPICLFAFAFHYQDQAMSERKVDTEQDTERQTMPRSLVENTFSSIHHKVSTL